MSTKPGTVQSSVEESARRAVSPVERVSQRVEAARLRGEGWSNKRIARELGVHPSTVGRWFARAHLPDTSTPEMTDGEEATR